MLDTRYRCVATPTVVTKNTGTTSIEYPASSITRCSGRCPPLHSHSNRRHKEHRHYQYRASSIQHQLQQRSTFQYSIPTAA
ncbi:MAG: hypothetical protein QF437_00225 [Planctomycetota bacterium]|nr:hypothetical protein [Planctomycetota bacterium]